MTHVILVVDDESGIRKVLTISLADMGHTVFEAENGEDAVKLIEMEHPSIVLTDIKMPGMDGIDLLQTIKKIDADIEVIMMTGHGDMDLAMKSLKFQATDFITKPISAEVVEIAIKRADDRISIRKQLRDYTENLEWLVEEKSRKLIEAERLAAFGEAVTGLSHTIKNIASGLKGGAFVLEKGFELHHDPYLTQGWTMIKGNVEKLAQLSLDLLNYGKSSELTLRPCDPNQPARDVFDLLLPHARSVGIALELYLTEDLAPVRMDKDAIDLCLHNLAVNAIDACIDDTCADGPKTVVIRTLRPLEWGVAYQIEDNGQGMDDATQKKLFQGIFSTKGGKGTGIGLMITQKTVLKHHGEITFTSESGKGTIFRICLPEM
jgi:signal transduction histidine kinase